MIKIKLWKYISKCGILILPEIFREVFKLDKKLPAEPLEDIKISEIPSYHFMTPTPNVRRCRTDTRSIGFVLMRKDIFKNPSACWFPDLMVQREINGTIYSVSGSYDRSELLDKKLTRIMGHDAKNLEKNE